MVIINANVKHFTLCYVKEMKSKFHKIPIYKIHMNTKTCRQTNLIVCFELLIWNNVFFAGKVILLRRIEYLNSVLVAERKLL